jgi:hypothetical protein
MTAIMVASIGAAAFTVSPLDTIVSVGTDVWFEFGTEDTFLGHGYSDNNGDPLGIGLLGGITEDTYVDGSATPRVVSHILYSEDTGGVASATDDSIFFGLVGISIPDTDLTFAEIVYNGVTYTRASATNYVSNLGGTVTYWQWLDVSPNGPTSGNRVLLINL